jgi:hypothetical protein
MVLQSAENNRRCGGVEGWLGRRWGSTSQRSRAASSQRREQVVPAALEEEDERLKMNIGRWIYIQRLSMSESFVD